MKQKKSKLKRRQVRNSIDFRMLSSMVLFFVLFFYGINALDTMAYFSDIEYSSALIKAGSLDMDIDSLNDFAELIPGSNAVKQYIIANIGTTNLQYSASVRATGTKELCGAIDASASLDGNDIYKGNFMDFAMDAFSLAAASSSTLELQISLGSDEQSLRNSNCQFELEFNAWQTGLPQGFSDREIASSTVNSGTWDASGSDTSSTKPALGDIVINEFLPNPEGPLFDSGENLIFDFGNDSDSMPQGEWVEIYNNTDSDIDLSGWYLRDSTDGAGNRTLINNTHITVESPMVPAHGWLVVYMNKPIYNNTGDTVRLFNADDELMDSYQYGSEHDFCELAPSPGENNDELATGTTCGQNIPGNKSYARMPDGIGEWVDPVPTPGESNIIETVQGETNENPGSIDPTEDIQTTQETKQESEQLPSGEIQNGSEAGNDSVIISGEENPTGQDPSQEAPKAEDPAIIQDPPSQLPIDDTETCEASSVAAVSNETKPETEAVESAVPAEPAAIVTDTSPEPVSSEATTE